MSGEDELWRGECKSLQNMNKDIWAGVWSEESGHKRRLKYVKKHMIFTWVD